MPKRLLSTLMLASLFFLSGCLDNSDDDNQPSNEGAGSTTINEGGSSNSVTKPFSPDDLDSTQFSQVLYQAVQKHLQINHLLQELPFIEWGLNEETRDNLHSSVEANQAVQLNQPINCYNSGQGNVEVDIEPSGIGTIEYSFNNCKLKPLGDGFLFDATSLLEGTVSRDFLEISEDLILHTTKYNLKINSGSLDFFIHGEADFENNEKYDRDTWKNTRIELGSAKVSGLESKFQDSLDLMLVYTKGQYKLSLKDWGFSFDVEFLNDPNQSLLELSSDHFSQSFIGDLNTSFELQGYCNLTNVQLEDLESRAVSCH